VNSECDVPELGLDWILPGRLAALACPDDPVLPQLASLGVKLLISLNEYPPDTDRVRRAGMRHILLPFADGSAPPTGLVEVFVSAVGDALERGEAVAAHCAAGVGRTGTMLACYLVSQGMGARDAIEFVRSRRPGSVENETQEQAVLDWWRRLHGWGTAGWH
jgi:atypical dual specificity phosphatase